MLELNGNLVDLFSLIGVRTKPNLCLNGTVLSVNSSPNHLFSKDRQSFIELIAGEGIIGDSHRGVTVQHRSRIAIDPTQPNLRQVHLIHSELFEQVKREVW